MPNYTPPLTPQQELTALAREASRINAQAQVGQHTKADAILNAGYRQAARRGGVSIGSAILALAGLLGKWGHRG